MTRFLEMDNTIKVVNQLKATSSTKEKQAILQTNKDDDTLFSVLMYTYNPFYNYGISEEVYDKLEINPNANCKTWDEWDCMFKDLRDNNINDELRYRAKFYIEQAEQPYRDLLKGILFKDLRIGANVKTFNKVWKGLFPQFDVQLAESFSKCGVKEGQEFYITPKLDGFRCVLVPNSITRKYTAYTRKGEVYEGIDHILEEAESIGFGLFVLDGELIARNDDNLSSGDLYKLTTKIARKKGKTKEKEKLEFHMFDRVGVSSFNRGVDNDPYKIRRECFEKIFEFATPNLKSIRLVPVVAKTSDQSVIPQITNELVAQGYEGAMINLADCPYCCKRHNGLLKVKQFLDADVYIKSIYEGTKQNKGKMGGVVIQYLYNGELHECECGSGFSQAEREYYWNNPHELIGKVMEIQYFEVTTNSKGTYGLRFPTYQGRIREDKTFDDITDVAKQ